MDVSLKFVVYCLSRKVRIHAIGPSTRPISSSSSLSGCFDLNMGRG